MHKITIELPGFTTVTRTIDLLVNQQAVVNLQLSPSTVQETVTVTGEAPLIDTTTSQVGGNIDPRQMQDLPINGRNWLGPRDSGAGQPAERLERHARRQRLSVLRSTSTASR